MLECVKMNQVEVVDFGDTFGLIKTSQSLYIGKLYITFVVRNVCTH